MLDIYFYDSKNIFQRLLSPFLEFYFDEETLKKSFKNLQQEVVKHY